MSCALVKSGIGLSLKEKLLRENLKVNSLKIVDDSHIHKNHSGYREGGNTHFTIKIDADEFKNIPPLKFY